MAKKVTEDFTINRDKESIEGLEGLKGISASKKEELSFDDEPQASTSRKEATLPSEEFEKYENMQGAAGRLINPPDFSAPRERYDIAPQSKFDKDIGDLEFASYLGYDINDLRDSMQTTAGKAVNALFNNVMIAGSTAVLGTAGFIYGIGAAIANSDINYLGNNSITQAENDVIKWADEVAPIYRGQRYNSRSFWSQLGSANFWTDLVKNLGYTEGMLVPGMGVAGLTGKVGTALGKYGKAISKVLSSGMSAVPEASVEAVSNSEDQMDYKKRVLYDTLIPEINKAARDGDEEKLESLRKQFETLDMAISEDARRSSNFIFLSNIALLTLSNLFEFGNVFGRGFESGERAINNRLKKSISTKAGTRYLEGNERIVGSTKGLFTETGEEVLDIAHKATSKSKAAARAAGKKVADGFSEYLEEVNQNIFASVPEIYKGYNQFNEAGLDKDAKENVDSFLDAWWSAVKQGFTDKETQIEGFQGLFTGILGAPTYVAGKGIRWVNSAPQEIREAIRQAESDEKLASKLNAISQDLVKDANFTKRYKGVIRHNALEKAKNVALYTGDKKAYKDAEAAQFVSDVEMFRQAGEIDLFKQILQSQLNLTDEDLQSIIDDKNGPYKDEQTKPSLEEARKQVTDKVNLMLSKIDSIVRISDELSADKEIQKASLDDDSFSTLVFLKSQIEDFAVREIELVSEISNFLTTHNVKVSKNISEKAEKKDLKEILQEFEKLLENENLDDEAVSAYKQQIKEYTEAQKNLEEKRLEQSSRALAGKTLTKPRDFDITEIINFLTGKSGDLSKDSQRVLDDVLEGIYTPLIETTVASEEALFDIEEQYLSPQAYNEIVKAATSDSRIAAAMLKAAKLSDDFTFESTQDIKDLQTLLKDRIRVAASREFYAKEFSDLYSDIENSNRQKKESKVKKAVKSTLEKNSKKKQADKIRQQKEDSGEDTTGKTDDEILHEEELKKDGADIAKSEYETIRNKILNSVEGLEDTEKELLKEHIDSLVDPILVDSEDSNEQTKESKYKEAISALLNHDNYSSLLVSSEHLKELKDAVRKMSEDRGAFTETSEPEPQEEPKKRFIESTPLEAEKGQSPQSLAESVNKNPIDAIVNAAQELVYEFENTKWAQTPIYIADAEQRKQILKDAKAKGVPESYINNVNFLHSVGAYNAVRELVADAFKKGKKLPVKFMMIEADANKFETEEGNPESKTNKIYHVIDVTNNEDWIRDHNTQLFEYKGRKYQVIGVHPENLNINGLKELNAKLRKDSNGNFEKNVWVSDIETFLTNMSRGTQDKGFKIRTLKEFIDYNRLPLKDIILGHVLTNESSKSMVFVNEKGEIEEAATGDMSAEFGTFLVMDSSDPNLHRYAKLTIPTLKEYLENNPDTQFTNMLIDTFTNIAKESIEHVGEMSQETLKRLLNTLHNLIYFGKNDTNGNIGIKSFDNGDTIGLVISMTSNEEGSEPQRTQLSISKNVSDTELRNIMKDFVLGRFKELTDSDALKFTTKDGGRFPLFRITMVAPKQYTNGSTSIEYAARALGLKGDPNTALKEFIINNNLLKTDLNSTKELNVKYYLAKYSPQSGTFEEVKYRPSKPESAVKQQPVTPQGVETSQKKNSIAIAIPVTAFSSNRKGNIQVTATIEDSKLVIRNKEGKNLNAIFDKAYRDELQQAMETNSALPKVPEFYTLTDGGKLYIAYYNNKGQLEVVDRDYDFIKDADEKVKIRKAFNEKINPDPIKKEMEDIKTLKPSDALAGLLDDNEGTPSSQPTAEPVKKAASEELPEATKRGLEGTLKTLISIYDKLRKAGGTEEGAKKVILNKAKQVCDTNAEYNYLVGKLTEILNSERGKKYNTAEPKANLKKELAWVNKALPQTANRVRIVQGFVKLLSDPSELYVGKFINGAIELSENYATKGVAYHEAFHFVFNALMNNTEREYLLRNARKALGENTSVIDAEEWLADMFADYVGKKETGFWSTKIGKALNTIFSWLKDMIGIANTNQSKINEMFNSIYKGEFANREMQEVSVERGKLYSEDVVNGAVYAFAQKLHADSIQRYKEGLVLSYTRKEHLRNEDFTAFKEAFKNYPVTVTSLSPSKLASVRNGRSVEANSGDECGILVSYSKEKEQQMEKQFKKEEQNLKYTTVQNERHAQNVELAYEACEGNISKEELKAMSDSTLEQIIYCK